MLINRDQVIVLLQDIGSVLADHGIPYLLYGSVAYSFITGDEVEWNDVDLIIRETEFEKVATALRVSRLALVPVITPFSIHANSSDYEGPDQKPFDVSLDSFEHYFAGLGIDLNAFQVYPGNIRVAESNALIRIYERGLTGGNPEKIDEYRRKLAMLARSARRPDPWY